MRKLSNRVLGVLSAAAICVSLGAGVPRVLEGKAESAKTFQFYEGFNTVAEMKTNPFLAASELSDGTFSETQNGSVLDSTGWKTSTLMKDPKTDASLTYAFAGGLQDFTYVGYMVGTGLGKKVEISVADTLDGVYTVAEVEPSVSDDSTYTYALSDIADSVRYVKLTFKATGYESWQFVLGYAQATVMADEYTKGAGQFVEKYDQNDSNRFISAYTIAAAGKKAADKQALSTVTDNEGCCSACKDGRSQTLIKAGDTGDLPIVYYFPNGFTSFNFDTSVFTDNVTSTTEVADTLNGTYTAVANGAAVPESARFLKITIKGGSYDNWECGFKKLTVTYNQYVAINYTDADLYFVEQFKSMDFLQDPHVVRYEIRDFASGQLAKDVSVNDVLYSTSNTGCLNTCKEYDNNGDPISGKTMTLFKKGGHTLSIIYEFPNGMDSIAYTGFGNGNWGGPYGNNKFWMYVSASEDGEWESLASLSNGNKWDRNYPYYVGESNAGNRVDYSIDGSKLPANMRYLKLELVGFNSDDWDKYDDWSLALGELSVQESNPGKAALAGTANFTDTFSGENCRFVSNAYRVPTANSPDALQGSFTESDETEHLSLFGDGRRKCMYRTDNAKAVELVYYFPNGFSSAKFTLLGGKSPTMAVSDKLYGTYDLIAVSSSQVPHTTEKSVWNQKAIPAGMKYLKITVPADAEAGAASYLPVSLAVEYNTYMTLGVDPVPGPIVTTTTTGSVTEPTAPTETEPTSKTTAPTETEPTSKTTDETYEIVVPTIVTVQDSTRTTGEEENGETPSTGSSLPIVAVMITLAAAGVLVLNRKKFL